MTFPARDPLAATRRIHFYHVDAGRDEATGERIPFDARATLAPLDGLDYGAGDAYHEADDKVTCCWIDALDPARLRIADIRRTNLPQVEVGGTLGPLVIEDRAGLAEQIHVRFFPDNVVGSDFNFYGPRMSRVSKLLMAKADVRVRFLPMVRGSILEELHRLHEVRLFDLSVHPSIVEDVERVDESVGAAFHALRTFGQAERLEVVLRPAPYSRTPLSDRILGALRALARSRPVIEGASTFRTVGVTEDGEKREIDLLKDELRLERPVRRRGDGSRALDAESVYAAIDSAYDELGDKLRRAHGVWMEAD